MNTGLLCIVLLGIAQLTCGMSVAEETQIAELRGILSFAQDFYNGLIAAPINHLSSSLAAMLAQVTLGVMENGIIGKRGLIERDFFSDFANSFIDAIYPHVDSLVQVTALQLTQWLANFANGKRDLALERGFGDWLSNFGSQIWDGIYPHVDGIVQLSALQLTQWLANFANGKRGAFPNLDFATLQQIAAIMANFPTLEQLTANIAEFMAQQGLGKRDLERGFGDWLSNFGSQIWDGIYPHVDGIVQLSALQLTQWLANFANGRREVQRGFFDFFSDLKDKLTDAVNSAAQTIAKPITQGLVNVINNGLLPTIGKRDLERLNLQEIKDKLETFLGMELFNILALINKLKPKMI